MNNIRSNQDLIKQIQEGKKFKYVYFWGHQKPKSGVSKSCFSQWYDSPFEADGKPYLTAEHFMMAGKARLFKDNETEQKILAAKNPNEAKKLGRAVKNFNDDVWLQNRFQIVVEANLHKFTQNSELKEFLLNTGDRILVEASPVDKIWGIGLAADDKKVEDPNKWRGLNLLGYALMEVRERLAAQ